MVTFILQHPGICGHMGVWYNSGRKYLGLIYSIIHRLWKTNDEESVHEIWREKECVCVCAWKKFSGLLEWDLLAKLPVCEVSTTVWKFCIDASWKNILLFWKIKRTKLLFQQECFIFGSAGMNELNEVRM